MAKQTLKTNIDTLFGNRDIVFVKYPSTWTAYEMCIKLDWAKTYSVKELSHDFTLIMAVVKPHYMEYFRRDNDKYVVKHTYKVLGDDECAVVENVIYDI